MFFGDTFLGTGERGILLWGNFSKRSQGRMLFRDIFSRRSRGGMFFGDTFLRVGERGILSGVFF